ncbi:hypothetical protein GKZ90_0004985 [Flavobacterium sp. MC2016-06]|uniref:hypothetical protein n=1 Tax=Flavobacterium sp. MC2016-06 TaxID=2676308 RepID=UPI0012BA949C|nr:hypothetical protein [Flavobacterium sp. MC2016-06]MBU3862487.1 hypothetical protein [Flavobacterium sp. MC2016-06]
MNPLSKFTILVTILLSFNMVNAQSLTGKWQADSDKLSDRLLDCYYFYPDNKFSYELNQYDGLKRLFSLSGIYKLSNNIIEFTVQKSKEKVKKKLEELILEIILCLKMILGL